MTVPESLIHSYFQMGVLAARDNVRDRFFEASNFHDRHMFEETESLQLPRVFV